MQGTLATRGGTSDTAHVTINATWNGKVTIDMLKIHHLQLKPWVLTEVQ
jgi:hypothetical protein